MNDEVKERLDERKEIVDKYLAESLVSKPGAQTTYSYDCAVSIGVAGGGFVNIDFKKNGNVFAQFKGGFAGGFGGYTGWGTAWFNKPVEELIGQSAAFTLEVVGILGGTAHVQITNANNFIGNCSTGGIGVGAGVGVGGGTFSAY